MPLILFILIIVLIAQIGFWDTFGAILGAVGMIALFVVILIAAVAIAGLLVARRFRR